MSAILAVSALVLGLVEFGLGVRLSGNLVCTFLDVKPAYVGMTNWFEAFVDNNDFLVRCGRMDDPRIDHFEYGSCGNSSSYELIIYKPRGDRPVQDQKMTLTLFPTWQPERSGFYIPVWLLIAGGKYFQTNGSGRIPLISQVPLSFPHLNDKAKARWQVQDGYLTEFIENFNGKFYSLGASFGEVAPQLSGATNISFRVLDQTNFNGLRLPLLFEYDCYYAKTNTAKPSLLMTIQGKVTEVSRESLPKRSFDVLNGVRVIDQSKVREGERLPTRSSFITNGRLKGFDSK